MPPVSRPERALATFVQVAPVLGVGVWVLLLVTHPGDYAYMFVLFMPGLVMLVLFGVLLPIVEIARSLMYGIPAARGRQTS